MEIAVKAYKYKSLNNIEYVLDIILHNRLYCANRRDLNDPMEGAYALDIAGNISRFNNIFGGIDSYNVCALSTTPDCVLLWGYYADGFRGVVIEVDLPDGAGSPMHYGDPYESINLEKTNKTDDELAVQILTTKYKKWIHENEIRVLQKEECYFDAPVKKVILGWKAINEAEEKSSILRAVCRQRGIEIEIARPVGHQPGGLRVEFTKWSQYVEMERGYGLSVQKG
jgi:hypothetical protein